MVRFTFAHRAEDGSLFGRNCFDNNIGKEIPVTIDGGIVLGVVVAAHVSDDQKSAHITVEVDEETYRWVKHEVQNET